MKLFRLLPLFALLLPAFAQTKPDAPAKPPADATAPAPPPAQLAPNEQAFLNLPEERRKEFAKHAGEASRLFQEKRIFETLDFLHKAEAIFAEHPEILNLRGSCYVEIRNFDKAMTAFKRALELSPNNPSIEFNIAEVLFVTGKWQESHDRLSKVLKGIPAGQEALSRLVEFKILLCNKKLHKDAEATAMAQKYTIDDDSPFYCYAQAALAYDKNDLIKAEEWLAVAGRIFRSPEILAPWQDTFVEYGYIKSFYGNDSGAED